MSLFKSLITAASGTLLFLGGCAPQSENVSTEEISTEKSPRDRLQGLVADAVGDCQTPDDQVCHYLIPYALGVSASGRPFVSYGLNETKFLKPTQPSILVGPDFSAALIMTYVWVKIYPEYFDIKMEDDVIITAVFKKIEGTTNEWVKLPNEIDFRHICGSEVFNEKCFALNKEPTGFLLWSDKGQKFCYVFEFFDKQRSTDAFLSEDQTNNFCRRQMED